MMALVFVCNSFMCWLSDFLNRSLMETHHTCQCSQHSVAPSAAWVALALGASPYFLALCKFVLFQLPQSLIYPPAVKHVGIESSHIHDWWSAQSTSYPIPVMLMGE